MVEKRFEPVRTFCGQDGRGIQYFTILCGRLLWMAPKAIYKSKLLNNLFCFADFADDILQQILPVLKAEGKTTQETIMTLLVISKTICNNSTECK